VLEAKPSLHLLVYSGDIDIATVPFVLSEPCLAELMHGEDRGRVVTQKW
jgi:hypothetical protein